MKCLLGWNIIGVKGTINKNNKWLQGKHKIKYWSVTTHLRTAFESAPANTIIVVGIMNSRFSEAKIFYY